MNDLSRAAKQVVEVGMRVKPGESFLIIADSYAIPTRFAQNVFDAANAIGVDTALALMTPRRIAGHEPPAPIAAAMKSSDAVVYIIEKIGLAHTDARKEANEAGARTASFYTEPGEDYLKDLDFTIDDTDAIAQRTLMVAEAFSKAESVRVTSPLGTDLTLSVEGREGGALYPCGDEALFTTNPEFAEAMVSPVEGTAEGVIVIDAAMVGWGVLLRKPLRLQVKGGRVVDIEGNPEDVEKLRKIISTDSNADNIAEFAIGTSHKHLPVLQGFRLDVGRLGFVHFGLGRNNDIGGETYSKIHIDGLMTPPTVELDDIRLVDNGKLMI